MKAFITDQGTAMAEATLCDAHAADKNLVAEARHAAAMSGDWNGQPMTDCGDNDALACGYCGATAESEKEARS